MEHRPVERMTLFPQTLQSQLIDKNENDTSIIFHDNVTLLL